MADMAMKRIIEVTASANLDNAARIVSAYVAHNSLTAAAVPQLIVDVQRAIDSLKPGELIPATNKLVPAIAVRQSVTPDYIVCLEDGKKFKSMKRHLTLLGMTPDQYRAKWGLPHDYPVVAPNYTATRSQLARDIGLGKITKTASKK